jgi:limonene 1,2-monooxygenase
MTPPLRFGAFTPPIQRPRQNPTWALERNLELVEWLDRIGYDEAWFGEHHNGGWELIGSPEIFIAAASQRTRHIKFGTGVTSLPYHHPFLVAERLTLLDHLTRGRVILGVGPGSLAFDAHVMGYDYQQSRRKTGEALEAIMQLLEDDEPVNMETDWFTLRDAQLHLKPYTYPRFEVTECLEPFGTAGRDGQQRDAVGARQLGADGRGGRRRRLRHASGDWGAQVGRAMEAATQQYDDERKARAQS